MSNLFIKFIYLSLCLFLLVSCGNGSGDGHQGQNSSGTIQQDQLAKNCRIRFSRNDNLSEISTKAFVMKSQCQLSENQVLDELKKI